MKPRLSLRSETLSELSATDLAGVAGGIGVIRPGTETLICLTGHYPTIEVTYCFEIVEEITKAIAGPSSAC